MPKGLAAREGDFVSHADPVTLTKFSVGLIPNVFIGGKAAWRAIPAGNVTGLQQAKEIGDQKVTAAEKITEASRGTPKMPEAEAAELAVKLEVAASMAKAITDAAGGGDIHVCRTPLPIPPHGIGVAINGSASVRINGLPACRANDTILEALGPANKINGGDQSVYIGD